MKLSLTLLTAMLVLGGCANTPNVYYTLTMQDSAIDTTTPSPDRSGSLDFSGLGPYTLTSIVVPAPVNDSMLVVRRSDDVLMKLAHDRWTAPLEQQFGNALSVALTRELGMPALSRAQAAVSEIPVTRMAIDVQQFDMVPGQYAALAVLWQITPAVTARAATRTCYADFRQSVTPGVAPLVRAQQHNINQLAKAMAQTWRTAMMPTAAPRQIGLSTPARCQ